MYMYSNTDFNGPDSYSTSRVMYPGSRYHMNSLRAFENETIDDSKLASYKVKSRRTRHTGFIIAIVLISACALAGLIYIVVLNVTSDSESGLATAGGLGGSNLTFAVDGGFGDWGEWGQCSVTCGGGGRHRNRTCDNPAPANGGKDCSGERIETDICNQNVCPVDGRFGEWSEWGQCSVTCGGGDRMRNRSCDNPAPAHGGSDCMGDFNETETCNPQPCPGDKVDGGFGEWSEWGQCSVTCGGGDRMRNRSCDSPAPANGGADCSGSTSETEACNSDTCPIHGGFGPWSEWGQCSVTCGGGGRHRNRSCDNPAPAFGGRDCIGDRLETEICNPQNCPVDGGFGEWSEWGQCSVTCGGGDRMRNRSCDNPAPAHGGSDCMGEDSQAESCNSQRCPIDGGFGEWSEWGQCSVTCGGGDRMRNRSCDNPAPAHGGSDCVGDYTQTATCNTQHCPVDGGFGEWSDWSECTVTCGGGGRVRNRSCDSPTPAHGGQDCEGDYTERKGCNRRSCPGDGGFGDWGDWGQCSVTCGGGARMRNRSCDNPGGNDCMGDYNQTESCNVHPCPVDGGFGEWSEWGQCSVTCGGGDRMRNRSCDNPAPVHGGNDCMGDFTETEACNTANCPVDGGFGEWSNWGQCSVTCGGGDRMRNRSCDNPAPAHGGSDCMGDFNETESCNSQSCPVDGGFGEWSEWDQCSVTCGGGDRMRNRSCDNPAPVHGGSDCMDDFTETEDCNTQHCPVDGGFGEWSEWGQCSVTCGGGDRMRNRSCDSPAPAHGGSDCMGDFNETEACNTQLCPIDGGFGEWSEWSQCSVTCGGGDRMRNRSCDNPAPAHGGSDCMGDFNETDACNSQPCPVEGGFGEWSEWGQCSVTCGGGDRMRNRSCDNPAQAHGGSDCMGDFIETEACNTANCPVDGGFGEWSEWGQCFVTCGGGNRMRNRSCDNPAPAHGGSDCMGDFNETETCNTQSCPVDGGFGEWSEWGQCSVTCGGGDRMRNRSCDNPAPAHGGSDCMGDFNETETCNTANCLGRCGVVPSFSGFRPIEDRSDENTTYFACKDRSKSVDIDSSTSGKCPRINCEEDNDQWGTFSATCGKGGRTGNELPGVDGTVVGYTGSITSPLFPNKYPDEFQVYYWTIITNRTSTYKFTTFDTIEESGLCYASVSIYCGVHIKENNPSFGPYCGTTLPPAFTCPTSCALVKFAVLPNGEAGTGFNLEWNTD